jgi:hypothetical protein
MGVQGRSRTLNDSRAALEAGDGPDLLDRPINRILDGDDVAVRPQLRVVQRPLW